MNDRPKLKIEPKPVDNIIEIAALAAFISLWVLSISHYNSLSEKIPIHFNASGEPDGYGSKTSLFILPVVGTFIFLLLSILNRYPHVFNYPVNITDENAHRQYSNATRLMRYVKFAVEITFLLIMWGTIQTATGRSGGLGKWFLPVTLAITFIPVTYFAVRSYRIR